MGHCNVCKLMTKWDTLMWDPPILLRTLKSGKNKIMNPMPFPRNLDLDNLILSEFDKFSDQISFSAFLYPIFQFYRLFSFLVLVESNNHVNSR